MAVFSYRVHEDRMKFTNIGEKNIKVRTGKRFSYTWITVKPGETIDLPKNKGKRYGLSDQKLLKVTEGKIGKKKVETKQFEDSYTLDDLFFKELTKIKGVGVKIAKDIVVWGTKEKLIEAIKLKAELPFRDDIVKKLRKEYGK